MDGFEKVRPSWKKISAKKVKVSRKEVSRITYTSVLNKDNISADRIGFSKAAKKLLNLKNSVKCAIFVHKKTKKIAICIVDDSNEEDTFTLSVSKGSACIRRNELFNLLSIPEDIIKMLRKESFHAEIVKEGNFFVAEIPHKINKDGACDISIDSGLLEPKSSSLRTTKMPMDSDLKKLLEDM
jgi:hypothetical protein